MRYHDTIFHCSFNIFTCLLSFLLSLSSFIHLLHGPMNFWWFEINERTTSTNNTNWLNDKSIFHRFQLKCQLYMCYRAPQVTYCNQTWKLNVREREKERKMKNENRLSHDFERCSIERESVIKLRLRKSETKK